MIHDPFKAKGTPPQTVFIVLITHKHGTNIAAYHYREGAQACLYQYVSEEWDDTLDTQYGAFDTLNPDQAIDAYFDCWGEAQDHESYIIEEVQVLPTPCF